MSTEEGRDERLRPCPFCGSDDVAVQRPCACPKCGERHGVWYVLCNTCGGGTGSYGNEEDAVYRWNGSEEWRKGEDMRKDQKQVHCSECGDRFVHDSTYDNPNGVEVMSCRDALEQLMVQDVCVQHGFEEGNEFCSGCGGRPEKFGGDGTCPWEYAKAALNATDNWDFETRKRMDLLCREIEHLRKRIKFLEACNERLTRKWEEQLAEVCSGCARPYKPRACDTMTAEDLIETVRKGIATSLSPALKDGIFPCAVESFIDLIVSTAIKCAYDTNLVVMEKKNEPGRPTA